MQFKVQGAERDENRITEKKKMPGENGCVHNTCGKNDWPCVAWERKMDGEKDLKVCQQKLAWVAAEKMTPIKKKKKEWTPPPIWEFSSHIVAFILFSESVRLWWERGQIIPLLPNCKFYIILKQMSTQLQLENWMLASLAYCFGGRKKRNWKKVPSQKWWFSNLVKECMVSYSFQKSLMYNAIHAF